jgi:large repetitive protein
MPRVRRLHRLLAVSQVLLLISSLLAFAAAPAGALASTVSGASFTGGSGTVSVSGTLYAKNGGALTLTVTTSSDTKCVEISGAHTARQTSSTAKSSWSFAFTAGSGDGLQTVTAAASPNFNANNCTGQSQSPQSASYSLDNTGPTVTAAVAPAPNLAGWNNANVAINWSATDSGSGVGSGPTPATDSHSLSTTGVTKTSIASDRLGNSGSGSVTIKLDKQTPTISGSRNPAANANGWNNTDVTVSFTCSDGVSGIKSCSGPTTKSANGAGQSVTGTAVDNADNSATATVNNISIDKTAPTLSGSPTTSPNAAGWYNGDVSIHWIASDALSGIDGSAPADSTLSSEGTALTATASVSDGAGNSTTATSSPAAKIDKTAPATNANATSAWTNTGQTVTLTPNDALSGVKATHYTVDGGAPQSGTSVSITTEGDHTLDFWSEDNAGNVESTKTVHVKVDQSPPTIHHTQTPGANANGWNKTSVTVQFVCDDALSGIASCTADQVISTEGANQPVTGTATDNAGNTTTDPATVSIDKTDPTISGAPDRAPNGNAWYDSDVTVAFSCGDALSGVDTCSAPHVLGEGANQSATGTAVDAAGNSKSATVSGIDVDETAPSLSGAATTSPNANGWYASDVTVAWSCNDGLSGIDGTCPADSLIGGEGSNLSASASVSDLAGNTRSSTLTGIKIDRTAPSTTATVPDPLASGWYAGSVPVTLNAVDTLSHVDATYYTVDGGAPQSYSGPFNFNEPGIHEITFWSVDQAGNAEDPSADGHNVTLKIDNLVPTISGSRYPAANAAGWNNGPVTVSFLCSDDESGIESCPDPTTLSTGGFGQSVTGTAVDNAGNSDSATVSGINIDLTAPVTSATLSPNAAWSNGSVQVSLSAVDPLSDVAATYHTIDGGSPDAATLSFSIAGEGVHTLTFWSVDKADNVEAVHTTTIQIDESAPTIGHALDPLPNGAGWNNSDVTVTFSCADQDGLSGIASCTAPHTVTTQGAAQLVNGTAVDHAGNSASDSATTNLDKTAPGITGAADRSPNANGWYDADVTVTFLCTDALSGVASCGSAVTLGEGADQSASGAAADVAGNTKSATVSGIDIDKTAPNLLGAPTTAPNGNGWYNGDVTIDWTCSDALSGIDGSCPADTTIGGEGTALTDSVSVSDLAGNSTTAFSSPAVKIDRTAPTTSAAASPSASWANSDVTVTLSPSDALSGVASTSYILDGGLPQIGTTVAISSEGTHDLSWFSVDNAGNVEGSQSTQIKIDKTAPSIGHVLSPVPNGAGWNNADVTVTFSCGDQADLSGVASCTPAHTVTTEGAGQHVNGAAVDNAGNTASDSATVNLDKTAPDITGAANRAPNSDGWYNDNVTVTFGCSDTLSGIAVCSGPSTLGEGADQSVTGSAVDNASNTNSATVSGIDVDKTPPTLSGAPTTSPNGAGWYNGDVAVHWTCADGLSGIAGSCPANSTIGGEGTGLTDGASVSDKAGNSANATSAPAVNIDRTKPSTSASKAPSVDWANSAVVVTFTAGDNLSGVAATWYTIDGGPAQSGTGVTVSSEGAHTVTFWSVDNAGNVEAAKSLAVKLDLSAPTINGAATTSPNASGWYHAPVTVHFTCADQAGLSGIQNCGPDKMLSTEGTNQSVLGEAVDKAGNSATRTVSGINIDLNGPTVSVSGVANGGLYTLGAVPQPGCSAIDGTSGLTAACSLQVTGGTANGVGTFSFTASATDVAGNTTTVNGTYRVIYRWDGFLQPINDTAHQIGVATSVFKAGSTVPVKFQLKRADGSVVPSAALLVWVTPVKGSSTSAAVDESAYADPATNGGTYRWDASGLQYIYNWGTAKNHANYYWRIGVSLDDGQTYYVNIGLR